MKLLVTGGSGGIGGYVVAELAQAGHTVTSFDRALPREQVAGVSYRVGDHEDLGQLVEVSADQAKAGLDARYSWRDFVAL